MIRLWEQPITNFLEFTGMLPFAILVSDGDKERLLQDIAQKIDEIPEQKTRQIIGVATYVLVGLVFEKNIIKQILRRDIMHESVTYLSPLFLYCKQAA